LGGMVQKVKQFCGGDFTTGAIQAEYYSLVVWEQILKSQITVSGALLLANELGNLAIELNKGLVDTLKMPLRHSLSGDATPFSELRLDALSLLLFALKFLQDRGGKVSDLAHSRILQVPIGTQLGN